MSRVIDHAPGQGMLGAGALAAALCRQAMEDGRQITFDYSNKPRVVEVHAIGQPTKDGSLVMRGWEEGVWKLYTLSKISHIHMNLSDPERASGAPREGYVMGDKQMKVLCELAI